MKKLINLIASMFVMTILLSSCVKKSDDPKPDTPVSVDSTSTLKFTATEATIIGGSGDTVKVDLTPYVTGSNKDSITVKTVTGALNTQVQNIKGRSFTVIPNNKVFAGTEKYTITISDGTKTSTSTFTINVGTVDQANTYALLAKYAFGKTLNGDVGNFKLSTDGTLESSANDGFYKTASATGGTYTILNNGYIRIRVSSALSIDYSVTEFSSGSTNGIKLFDNIRNRTFLLF